VASHRTLKLMDALIWVLVFGGLLSFVLGVFIGKTHDVLGFWFIGGGACAVVVGVLLFFVRSQLK
jgi:hypothetical protein